MSRVAYFDCFSGCSGDMILGALLDLGLPLETLERKLGSLALGGYRLSVQKVKRSIINASKFTVVMDENLPQPERSLADILKIIDESSLSKAVKEKGSVIFRHLGEAEAAVHGASLERVYFHEVGAVDSIIDIMGALLGFEALKIERFYSSPITVGNGWAKTAHGVIPVPAPATLQLLALAQAPMVGPPLAAGEPSGELVTPTGAALITSLAIFRRPNMTLEKVGYGAGSKEFVRWPNALRICLGKESNTSGNEDLVLLETNIDNMSPEIYGYLMEKLFSQEAADVWFTPIQMKKNRPATMLSVLAPRHAEFQLTESIMRETSTLGIRVRSVSRHIAGREIIEFDSSLGHARAKIKHFAGNVIGIAPEYEDCRRIALERNMPLREVYNAVEGEARRYLAAPGSG